MTFLEKIKFRFPKFAEVLYEFAGRKKNSVFQDMLLCAGVSLVSAFYEFEEYFMFSAVEFIRNLLVFLTICCWIWCAFINGFWKKYSFLVFTAAFWLIPKIIIYQEEHTGIRNYSKYLDAAAQFSRLISQYSISRLAVFLNSPLTYALIALISWCLLAYFIGVIFKKKYAENFVKTLAKEKII